MAEIREVDKEYIKSHSKWNRENELVISELEMDISNSEQKIELQQKFLDLYKERLEQSISYRKSSDEEFNKWLNENNITQSDLIDL